MLEVILSVQIPLWILAVAVVMRTVMLMWTHRLKMPVLVNLSLAVPSLFLAFMYWAFWYYQIPTDIRRFIGTNALLWAFVWDTVLLMSTRKLHNVL